MSPELSRYLLIAEFIGKDYANALIFNHLIVTAAHVAKNGITILDPVDLETGRFTFKDSANQDLSISEQPAPAQGFCSTREPQLDETVVIAGHHGPNRQEFQITAKVIQKIDQHRVVVQRQSGIPFQPGMSGSPAVAEDDSLIGILVEGVDYHEENQVILELLSSALQSAA